MLPLHLYLTRHGRTPWNLLGRFQGHTDVPLDEVGRAQAAQLAETLRGRIEAVVSSDLLRASETAQIVSAALAIPVLAVDPDLRERGYGVFEGLTSSECMARFPAAWAARERDRNAEPPGGEPRSVVLSRMKRGLENATAVLQGRHRRALIVSHGSSLRMFLEALTSTAVASLGNMESREVVHDARGFRLVGGDGPR
ncbi:MAG: phosphoglycerate mutase [Myxococcaceae bacterium]|nr:phosphoglycerate mutase [Myxococcaceae bacterium]